MKIFKITASDATYDEYESIVVVAESEERALEIAKWGRPYDWQDPDKYSVYWLFTPEQYPLLVDEISLKNERVIVSELIGS